MPEALTLELVLTQLRDLTVAFPARMDEKSLMRRADVYYGALEGLSGDALKWATKKAIQSDKFFPKVARLRELADLWTHENRVTFHPQVEHVSGWCNGCETVARPQLRWRPVIDKRGRRIRDDAGRILLAQYERIVCRCDAPCAYEPDDETSNYMSEHRQRPAAGGTL